MPMRLVAAMLALAATAGYRLSRAAESPVPPTALAEYIKRAEPDYAWTLKHNTSTDAGTVYDLHLVSQKWQDEIWEHDLQVYVPAGVKPGKSMVIYNTGGKPNATSGILGVEIAKRVGAPVAFLFGIPKQPLYGGKKEDALIAETFVRFLDTGDTTWPLLFPMAKSLIKAMDALQAFSKEEWNEEVTEFIITGASKRGWTSWLTAATGDKRVKAIAPMVIDTLNFQKQIPLHITSFGHYSRMIHDYEERGLLPLPDTDAARQLWSMVDPWVYREKLTLPKLILNGTNDPYWPQDATNQYWNDLKGEKYLLYVPNAGHDLREVGADGTKQMIPMRAINTLAAFSRHVINGKPMPKLTWTHGDENGKAYIAVESDQPIKAMRLWEASAQTRDFRESKWSVAGEAKSNILKSALSTTLPEDGFKALFVECDFEIDGNPYSLTTQLRIVEAKK
jgi:PhoPQ-activated pathogenicity-related protein